ncbi:MAG: hypothetical protein QM749_17970 [Aquabacterium sp.]
MQPYNTRSRRGARPLIALFGFLMALSPVAHSEPMLGIGAHILKSDADNQTFLKWISQSAFKSVRQEVYWSDIEVAPQKMGPTDRAQRALQVIDAEYAAGIEPLLVLDYGNPLYDGGTQPYSDQGRQAFARYAEWMAQTTKGKVKQFEIWNEWNIGLGTRPRSRQGSAEDYVKLTKQASLAIHKANPGALVVGGALGDDFPDWAWLKQAIQYGLLNYVDGISIHLYNHSLPIYKGGAREMLDRIARVHDLIKKASPNKDIPIYITELGWPNNVGQFGVSLTDAATQASIFWMEVNALDYVKGVWFYVYKNPGRDISDREQNFGLFDADNNPKPIECALESLGKKLKGAKLVSTREQGASKVMLYRLTDGTQLLGTWTPWRQPNRLTQMLEFNGKHLDAKPLDLGCFTDTNSSKAAAQANSMKLEQGYSPSFYILPADSTLKF